MDEKKQHFQHIMLYYFRKDKNTTKIFFLIVQCMEKVLWLIQHVKSDLRSFMQRFHSGPCSTVGKPVQVDSNQIKTWIKNNQCYITQEIANILKISKSRFENYLHQLCYIHLFDVWIPHKWKNLLDYVSACKSLFNHNENVPFFKTNCDKRWKVDTV